MSGMPPIEQVLRTISKLDEIEMFMIDYKDIISEFDSKNKNVAPSMSESYKNQSTQDLK